MYRQFTFLLVIAVPVVPASGQPRLWSDDFQSLATYNSTSWLAPCYGPPGTPSTKYTILEGLLGDVANQRAYARNGRFAFTNRSTAMLAFARYDFAMIGAVNLGQGCPDMQGVSYYGSTEQFTSDNICMYGGHKFSPWQLKIASYHWDLWDVRGPDGVAGVEGVNDDLDNETDEDDETHQARWTTVNAGFGNADGTGFQAGLDAAPGALGIDDDANGTTDDVGETGAPDTDDGDDVQRQVRSIAMNVDFETTRLISVNMDLTASAQLDQFSIREIYDVDSYPVEFSNEMAGQFYEPHIHYNWVFCGSGSCYGAMLWTGTDMANPDETVGPVINTHHLAPTANKVGFGYPMMTIPPAYLRQLNFLGNTNFGGKFWVISGHASQYYPEIAADFDDDKDVDGQDFMKFSKCFNGSLRPPKATCENPEANFDGDIDVDGQDFMAFSKCFNGSLRRPKCLPPILTLCQ